MKFSSLRTHIFHTVLSKMTLDTASISTVLALINDYIRSIFLISCIFLTSVAETSVSKQCGNWASD